MTPTLKGIALLSLLLIPLQGTAQLFTLIDERLELMKSVAAYKWIHEQPIENRDRETVVVEAAVMSGLKHGITAPSSSAFFRAQIEAAKDIQRCWFDRWKTGKGPASSKNLVTELRPRLIELGDKIASSLVIETPARTDFDMAIKVDCLSARYKQQLFHTLSKISRYPDRLTQIRHAGILRIGTTADYAPFSFRNSEGDLTGIDIDLARDLAKSLGVTPHFVETSWPTLSEDLLANEYDVAMSGVSITDSRLAIGFMSAPYHTGGKTPITLCHRVHEFDSLEKIDRPGTKIIVNPGGTNERFVDTAVKETTKVLHQDNRTIFDAIVAEKADLMITDSIEVALQSKQNPALCAAMPGQLLTHQQKGFLMPKDEGLRKAIDDWLRMRLDDGLVNTTFATYLDSH